MSVLWEQPCEGKKLHLFPRQGVANTICLPNTSWLSTHQGMKLVAITCNNVWRHIVYVISGAVNFEGSAI